MGDQLRIFAEGCNLVENITNSSLQAADISSFTIISELANFYTMLIPTIIGTEGDDEIHGPSGTDVILGLGGNDTINAGSSNDAICAGDGDDVVFFGSSSDELFGNSGKDTLSGGAGNDKLMGQSGADTLDGGPNTEDGLDFCDGEPVMITQPTVRKYLMCHKLRA